MSASATRVDDRLEQSNLMQRVLLRPEIGAGIGAVVLWVAFAIAAGENGFLTLRGTATYLEVSAELGILAVAVALLMISGEFDLSIGSIIGASGMIIAILSKEYGWNIWWAILVALFASLAVGAINGIIVRWSRLPSFIITLASMFVLRGLTIALTRKLTNRTNVGGLKDVPGYDSAARIFASDWVIEKARLPVSIVWWLGLAAVATWILMRTRFGNWVFGVGGGEQAARNVGVPVTMVKITLFMGTAASAWLLSVIQVLSTTGADVLRGQQQEFFAIIAVVIGGTLLTGGYGSAIGAALGALIFGLAKQGIFYARVDSDWFQVFLGGMVLIAVLINQFARTRLAGVK